MYVCMYVLIIQMKLYHYYNSKINFNCHNRGKKLKLHTMKALIVIVLKSHLDMVA